MAKVCDFSTMMMMLVIIWLAIYLVLVVCTYCNAYCEYVLYIDIHGRCWVVVFNTACIMFVNIYIVCAPSFPGFYDLFSKCVRLVSVR